MVEEKDSKTEQEQPAESEVTVALTQLFLRVVAMESVLVEQKIVTPEQLATAQLKAMEKLAIFQQQQQGE